MFMQTNWSCLLISASKVIMPPPRYGGGIKRCFCLTSVWRLTSSVAYIGPNSRTERPRKTKIGCSGRRGNVLVVGNCCYVAVCSARRREALGRPRGEERGGGILCRHAHSLFTEDYNWLLPYGVADSVSCTGLCGLCAHSMCRSTMPARQLSANDSEETMVTQLCEFEPLQISYLESDARSFFESFIRS